MKKYFKLMVFLILVFVLIICICLTQVLYKNEKKVTCDFDFEELLLQVNLTTNNSFLDLANDKVTEFIPLSLTEDTQYLFSSGVVMSQEYFLIIKNIEKEVLFDLENYIKTNNNIYFDKQIIFGANEEYTYVIYSPSYDSTIEGIIRSYIYCE